MECTRAFWENRDPLIPWGALSGLRFPIYFERVPKFEYLLIMWTEVVLRSTKSGFANFFILIFELILSLLNRYTNCEVVLVTCKFRVKFKGNTLLCVWKLRLIWVFLSSCLALLDLIIGSWFTQENYFPFDLLVVT